MKTKSFFFFPSKQQQDMSRTTSSAKRVKTSPVREPCMFHERMRNYIDHRKMDNVTWKELDFLCKARRRAGHFFVLTQMQFHALVITLARKCSRSESDELQTLRFYGSTQTIAYEPEDHNLMVFEYAEVSDGFPYNRLDVGKRFAKDCIALDTKFRKMSKDTRPNFIMFSVTAGSVFYISSEATSGRLSPLFVPICCKELREPEEDCYHDMPVYFGEGFTESKESTGQQRVLVDDEQLGIYIDWRYDSNCQALVDFRNEYQAKFNYC